MNPILHQNYHGKTERVVAIIYHHDGKDNRLLPFNVFTVDHENPPDNGWIAGLYDFDWCQRDETLYYHYSGGGGRFYIGAICEPNKPPRCAVWWDSKIVFPTNGGSLSNRKLSNQTVQRFGYDTLDAPLPIDGEVNPFENSCMDSVEYCSKCNDHLPTENPCSHIWWCEKCADYSKPGERCKHRRN